MDSSDSGSYVIHDYDGQIIVKYKQMEKYLPRYWFLSEVILMITVLVFAYCTYFHFDKIHHEIIETLAHLGHPEAQHTLGQRYFQGEWTPVNMYINGDAISSRPTYTYFDQANLENINGKMVTKDKKLAFHWFERAADQGHPHASYNLGVAHLKGYKTGLKRGLAHQLIKYASDNGVHEAADFLERKCSSNYCYR